MALASGADIAGIIFAFSKFLLVEIRASVFKPVHHSVSVSLTNGSERAKSPFSSSLNSPLLHLCLRVGSSSQVQRSRRRGKGNKLY
jgi:hypothetical protein